MRNAGCLASTQGIELTWSMDALWKAKARPGVGQGLFRGWSGIGTDLQHARAVESQVELLPAADQVQRSAVHTKQLLLRRLAVLGLRFPQRRGSVSVHLL